MCSNEPLLHLQEGSVRGGEHGWLVHGLHRGRTDAEFAGVYDLEQVNVFLVTFEIRLEESRVVVMELTAREPESPPIRLLLQFIKVITLDKLSAGGNGIFHQQVAPIAAVHAETYGNHVTGVN